MTCRYVEDSLQIATKNLCDIIIADGVIYHHSANERHGAKAGAKAKAMGQMSGFPDWVIIWADTDKETGDNYPVVGFIELKTSIGRMSENQRRFRDICNAVGAEYAICRSVDDFHATLKAWGVPMKSGAKNGPKKAIIPVR